MIGVLLVLGHCMAGQIVNGYARISAVSNGSILTLSNVNQAFGTFAAGEEVIVIQMQGATISSTANSSTFGNLASLNSAGLYEVAVVSAVNSGPTSLTLAAPLANSYNTAGGLQVVTYPRLSSTSYTTTSNINGLAWDGTKGGVIAFSVGGNLTIAHTISADGLGFRGGALAGNDGSTCESTVWRTSSGNAKYADKGEGVYITTNMQRAGKAKAVNGGGGALVHNGGGGGGANYTSGGDGYFGFDGDGCSSSVSAGGRGGIAIASSAFRVFMGGGGGGGQENNGNATNGGNGGGIVFLRCDTLVTTGTCSAPLISANGAAAANTTGHDGAGGGGGGGSVVLDILGVRATSACNLSVSANGGNGGDVLHPDNHGSGGGGGQGTVLVKANGPFTNTTFHTLNGIGGLASTQVNAPRAGNGGGADNSGIRYGMGGIILPVEILYFKATEEEPGVVDLRWATVSEVNCDRFEIFHSDGRGDWEQIGAQQARGSTHARQEYSMRHYEPARGLNYYRIRQADKDGSFGFSDIAYADIEDLRIDVTVFPVPASHELNVVADRDITGQHLRIVDGTGRHIVIKKTLDAGNAVRIDVSALAPGIYFLVGQEISVKFIVQ